VKRWGVARRVQRSARPHGSCVHAKASLGWGSLMSIIGLGFDATDIPRIRDVFEQYGERFLHRIFTTGEIAYCKGQRDPVPSLAARFAAKEAAMKALGTGHSRGVLWKDIEVIRHGGPPQLRLTGGALRRFDAMQARRSLLTLTHSDALAMAQVLLLDD
jgi:holo-[acyl-carrier protein] synthase